MRSDNPVGQGDAPPPLRRPVALLVVAGVLLVATLALILAVRAGRSRPVVATYVGSERCEGCHPGETAAWRPSNHAQAMQGATRRPCSATSATPPSSTGARPGASSGKANGSWSPPRGRTARMHDYEVAYTFGVEPLQQYLVAFPGGRLQALSAAWDTRAKRWFHVNPGPAASARRLAPLDAARAELERDVRRLPLDDVRKGYDPEQDSVPDHLVGGDGRLRGLPRAGLAPRRLGGAAGHGTRRKVENAALVTRTSKLTGQELVEQCAPCHARRAQFADQGVAGGELLDRYLPVLLVAGHVPPGRPDPRRGLRVALVHAEQDVRERRPLQRLPRRPLRASAPRRGTRSAPAATAPTRTTRPPTTSTSRSGTESRARRALRLVPHAGTELHGGPLPARPLAARRPGPTSPRQPGRPERLQPAAMRTSRAAWVQAKLRRAGTARPEAALRNDPRSRPEVAPEAEPALVSSRRTCSSRRSPGPRRWTCWRSYARAPPPGRGRERRSPTRSPCSRATAVQRCAAGMPAPRSRALLGRCSGIRSARCARRPRPTGRGAGPG